MEGAGSPGSAGKVTQPTDPAVKLYEIKPSPGKGLGVFAAQDIKCGTRLLSERPLIHISSPNQVLKDEYARLTAEQQSRFWSLHSFESEAFDGARATFLEKLRRTTANRQEVELVTDISAVYTTNHVEVERGNVLCLDASRTNHSCVPNVFSSFNARTGFFNVHAVRDIAAGEEVFTSYVPASDSRAERQRALRKYGFQCECRACDEATEFGRAFEERRVRMLSIDQEMCGLLKMGGSRDDKKVFDLVKRDWAVKDVDGRIDLRDAHYFLLAAESFAAIGKLQTIGQLDKTRELTEKAAAIAADVVGTDSKEYPFYKEAADEVTAVIYTKSGTFKTRTSLPMEAGFFNFDPSRST